MTEKDKASPRQRQIMEERWKKAREDCPAGKCLPTSRFHVAGCERRTQKVKVTNLNTGQTSEATIVHSDARAVKDVLAEHDKQAVLLEPVLPGFVEVKDVNDLTQAELDEVARVKNEGGVVLIPEEMTFDRTYWDAFERGMGPGRQTNSYGGVAEQIPLAEQELLAAPDQRDWTGPGNGVTPPRPWWKFWGRRA